MRSSVTPGTSLALFCIQNLQHINRQNLEHKPKQTKTISINETVRGHSDVISVRIMTSLDSELTRRYQMAQFFRIIWYGAVLKLDKGEMNSRKSGGKDPVLGGRNVQGLYPHQETEHLMLGREERRGWSKLNMEEGNPPAGAG